MWDEIWRNPALELRVGPGSASPVTEAVAQTPIARFALRPKPRTQGRALFVGGDALGSPRVPAVVLTLEANDGRPVSVEALAEALPGGARHHEAGWLLAPARRVPARWVEGLEEAAADAVRRALNLAPGWRIDTEGRCHALGSDLAPTHLVPLPRVVVPPQWMLGDNTDPALSMEALLFELLEQFGDGPPLTEVSLASGYLYRGGLYRLLKVLEREAQPVERMRLLFSGRTDGLTARAITANLAEAVAEALEGSRSDQFVAACRAAVEAGRLEVRVYPDTFLHAKLFVGRGARLDTRGRRPGIAALGSSNLSQSGLGHAGNLELDVVVEQAEVVDRLATWFERRWEEGIPPEPALLEVIEGWRPPAPPTFETEGLLEVWQAGVAGRLGPPTDHLRFLSGLYEARLRQLTVLDAIPFPGGEGLRIQPSPEQVEGAMALANRLRNYRLAFLADSVGLGKTATALGAAWLLQRAGRIAQFGVVAAAKLHQQWVEDAAGIGLPATQFARVNRHLLEREDEHPALAALAQYDLLVVDEAHESLRNRRNKLWSHLRAWLAADLKRMVMLVSATPWNNSREDIYSYMALAWVERQALAESFPAVPSLGERTLRLFAEVGAKSAREFCELDQATYNGLFGTVFVQRTRHSLAMRHGGGTQFPRRRVHAKQTPASPDHDGFFRTLGTSLATLRVPYREPLAAVRWAVAGGGDAPSSNLQRSFILQLYKRAESSLFALAVSLEGVSRRLTTFERDFEAIEASQYALVALTDWLEAAVGDPEPLMAHAEEEAELTDLRLTNPGRNGEVAEILAGLDDAGARAVVRRLLDEAVTPDLETIATLRAGLTAELEARDPSALALLEPTSRHLAEQRKVILVAAYADTALRVFLRLIARFPEKRIGLALGGDEAWLYTPGIHRGADLDEALWNLAVEAETATDRRRLVLAEGKRARAVARTPLLGAFAPRARNGEDAVDQLGGEIDVLVGSEAISVGQNLQDATALLHLDLPWNPMVLEQRIGRVDRRGGGYLCPTDRDLVVDIHYCWSLEQVEQEVGLRERLTQKATGAMRDTRFDELLLYELREAVAAARDESTRQQNAADALDGGAQRAAEAAGRVEGTEPDAGAELDGLDRLGRWRATQGEEAPGAPAPEPVVACAQIGGAGTWRLTLALEPQGETGRPLGGVRYAHVAVPDPAVLEGALRPDLDAVVAGLVAGEAGDGGAGLKTGPWTQALRQVDQAIQAGRARTLAAHNAAVRSSLLAAPRRPSAPQAGLVQLARDALTALTAEMVRDSALFKTPHRPQMRRLMDLLKPENVWFLVRSGDEAEAQNWLQTLARRPHWAWSAEGFAECMAGLLGEALEAMAAEPAQTTITLPAADQTWASLGVKLVAATWVMPER